MPKAFDAECVELSDVSRIKLEECGRKIVLLNPANEEYRLIRVDGCVIKNGLRADWLVEKKGSGSLIVELKGTDVGHAVQQVEATLSHFSSKYVLTEPVGAIIICQQVPKAATTLQTAVVRIRKKYKAKLKVSSSQHEFKMDALV